MQYQVERMDQTQDNGQGAAGSTPGGDLQPTRRTKKILKNQPDFSRTCGFRGVVQERLVYHITGSKVTIDDLDFRQNPLKVEKPQKRPFFRTVS